MKRPLLIISKKKERKVLSACPFFKLRMERSFILEKSWAIIFFQFAAATAVVVVIVVVVVVVW